MTKYATVATAVLLTAVVLNNVCRPGWAASKGDTPSPDPAESDSDGDPADYDQDHEDQLDEDDPGNSYDFNLISFDNKHVCGEPPIYVHDWSSYNWIEK